VISVTARDVSGSYRHAFLRNNVFNTSDEERALAFVGDGNPLPEEWKRCGLFTPCGVEEEGDVVDVCIRGCVRRGGVAVVVAEGAKGGPNACGLRS